MAMAPRMQKSAIKILSADAKRHQSAWDDAAVEHAVRLIYRACCLAGSGDLISDVASGSVRRAIERRNTPALFDWLVSGLSYQGISDRVAHQYMRQHGRVRWRDIEASLGRRVGCPKLRTYWHFHDCRYDKGSRSCAEPDRISRCPLPRHDLRNGRLNQTAYSLYLFIRDIADGDLVAWIDRQLAEADRDGDTDRLERMGDALIEPLRNVFGVSDKVLTMVLSGLLLAAPGERHLWVETGAGLIAVDSLVHNFLHRTGILHRLAGQHAYGVACYRPCGCADIIRAVARRIDASQFNRQFPQTFPRFVQHAIWRYCAQQELDICNGNRIDDHKNCDNIYCRLHSICDRITLNNLSIKKLSTVYVSI